MEHIGKWKVYLGDGHQLNIEKSLEALLSFLPKASAKTILAHQNEIIATIIEKGLFNHNKSGIKDRAIEAHLSIFEMSNDFDESIQTLRTHLTHKNVKIVANANLALAHLVSNYGAQRVKISAYEEIMIMNA